MKLAVFEKILSLAEKAVWGLPTLLLLVGVGVYLTVRTRFFQFRTFLPMLKHTLGGIFAPKKDRELAATRYSHALSVCFAPRSRQLSARAISPALPMPWSWAAPVRYSGCGSRPLSV